MENKDYTTWLNNEYTLWQNALKEAPFYKFKHHPAVIRMIGLADLHLEFVPLIEHLDLPWQQLESIDQIGSPQYTVDINGVKLSGVCLRFIYYANRVLDSVKNMTEIKLAEIGGGYGGFCAVVHLVARHRGIKIKQYTIYDLVPVQEFQEKYLKQIVKENSNTGIKSLFFPNPGIHFFIHGWEPNFIMSFYALGEFDNATKNAYIENIISKVPHGLVIWNPHSGSDNSLDLLQKHHPSINVKQEYPLTSINNQEVTW